jgi:inhibitor of cysteine peptidase
VKRFLLLLAALAIGLAGCIGGVATYTDAGQAIDTEVNQEFVIALGSNPSTGYSWQASYDETMLELVGGQSIYKPGEEAEGMVGAGGVEYFRFKALETGRTEVTLVYKRPFEEPTPQDLTKVFTIHIR